MAANGILSFGRNLMKKKETVALALGLAVAAVLALGSPHFFDPNNLDSLQTSIAPSAIIAVGMMVLLINGMFDLSVGSIMGLSGVVTAIFLTLGLPVWLSFLIGLACGALLGLINGVIVAVAGVNPLITTMGMMFMARGISEMLLVGKGREGYRNFDPGFINLGTGKIGGIYIMFWVMLVLVALAQFYVSRFPGGRRLYYIGGNPSAASLMGFNLKRIRILAFVASGLFAALAGILSTARYEMANRYMGQNLHMNIIISCLIGGGSIAGGQGSIVGALFGVAFMSLLTDAFNLLEVESQWQSVVIGAVLILVVLSDGWLSLRKQRALGKI